MLVFIDEAGCNGFKFDNGSSKHFIVTMAFFPTPQDAEHAGKIITNLREDKGFHKEFHFKSLPNKLKDAFLTEIRKTNFFYRTIVIDKSLIYSDFLKGKGNSKAFYSFVVGQMCTHDGGYLNNSKIFVDATSDKMFQKQLSVYIRRKLREKDSFTQNIRFKDWKQNSLIQVADMVCGSIFRSFEKGEDTYRNMIKSKEDNLWIFK